MNSSSKNKPEATNIRYQLPGDFSFYFGMPGQTMEDAERILREALAPTGFDTPKRADDTILIAFREQPLAILNERNPTLGESRMLEGGTIPYGKYQFEFTMLEELESPDEVEAVRYAAKQVQQVVGDVMFVCEDQDEMDKVIEL
jgi:hypothetical protein